jgi:CCDC81-like prokaryotic HU domain 1
MDLAIYISELLGLRGEVNLPGVGHFSQVRIDGYYVENGNKLYPPAHRVNFQPQLSEDDSLAKYITDKKNISLASSKYFIDKYVIGVKQQVATQKVDLAGLGYLYTEKEAIAFKSNSASRSNDPEFYGFPPIEIYKIGQQRAVNSAPSPAIENGVALPVTEDAPINKIPVEILADEPVSVPELVTGEEKPKEQSAYIYEDEPESRRASTWVIVLLVIIVAILAATGAYIYKPSLFNRILGKETIIGIEPKVVKTELKPANKPDTVSKTVVKTTSVPKSVQAPVDTFATVHYDILGGAYQTLTRTNTEISNYQKLGLKPVILKHAKGKLYKINLGTYFNKDQAEKVKDSILSIPKIIKSNIYLQPYQPKK